MSDLPEIESSEPSCTADEHSPDRAPKPFVDNAALERASRLFRAIGEPARLRILSRLAQGEMCVTELAASEGESLSTISQRLRVLRSENILSGGDAANTSTMGWRISMLWTWSSMR